jgi:hypothetical protein
LEQFKDAGCGVRPVVDSLHHSPIVQKSFACSIKTHPTEYLRYFRELIGGGRPEYYEMGRFATRTEEPNLSLQTKVEVQALQKNSLKLFDPADSKESAPCIKPALGLRYNAAPNFGPLQDV